MENISPFFVKNKLKDILTEMSSDLTPFVKNPTSDFTRERKLGFAKMMNLFISKGSGTLKHELLEFMDYHPNLLPTPAAFYQQRSKLDISAFKHALKEFNNEFPLTTFRDKYYLLACDGTGFNIARNPDDPSTFTPSNGTSQKGFNMIHATALYDIFSKRFLDMEVQPGREKDEYRALCNIIDRYSYGGEPIIIADRGFASHNTFAHAIENDIKFIIRAQDNNTRRYLKIKGDLPNTIDTNVETILARTTAKKLMRQPHRAKDYRYVYPNVPFDYIDSNDRTDEYTLSIRILRFQIGENSFENIITNLPPEEFSLEDIKECYYLRWGIETSFRELKHELGAINFHSKQYEYINMELWSCLIAYNFCSVIIVNTPVQTCNRRHDYQVDYATAFKICIKFLRNIAMESQIVTKLILAHILPIRKNRNYERRKCFHPPASFTYRGI